MQRLRVLASGSFLESQFIANQLSLVGTPLVPIAAIGRSEFTASNRTVRWLFNPAVNSKRKTGFTHIGLVGDVPMVLVALSPKRSIRALRRLPTIR